MIYEKDINGIYSVPTDWTMTIAYEIEDLDGKIQIQTWVDAYV